MGRSRATEGAAERRAVAQGRYPCATALGMALSVVAFPVVASAMAPPVELALETVGREAGEGVEQGWAMTKVGDGIVELCGDSVDGEGRKEWTFSGDGVEVEVGPESETPWDLVWGMVWSSGLDELLSEYAADWGEETARIEIVDGEPAYCYGAASRLCVDEKLRRVVALDVEVEGTRWAVRVSDEGRRVMVSEEGSLVARLRAGEECGR